MYGWHILKIFCYKSQGPHWLNTINRDVVDTIMKIVVVNL